MWIELVDPSGKVIGAVNSECCDLIRIDTGDVNKAAGGALIRSATSTNADGSPEVYKTKVSYLRLIETLTQSEIKAVQQIADMVKDTEDRAAPRLVIP